MPVARHPPYRSQRALLMHWAPASSTDAHTFQWIRMTNKRTPCSAVLHAVSSPAHLAEISSSVPGPCFAWMDSSQPAPFSPPSPPQACCRLLCSMASQILWGCQTPCIRSSLPCSLRIFSADLPSLLLLRPYTGPPDSRARNFRACMRSPTPPGLYIPHPVGI